MNLGRDQGIAQWRDPEWHWRMAERYYFCLPEDERR